MPRSAGRYCMNVLSLRAPPAHFEVRNVKAVRPKTAQNAKAVRHVGLGQYYERQKKRIICRLVGRKESVFGLFRRGHLCYRLQAHPRPAITLSPICATDSVPDSAIYAPRNNRTMSGRTSSAEINRAQQGLRFLAITPLVRSRSKPIENNIVALRCFAHAAIAAKGAKSRANRPRMSSALAGQPVGNQKGSRAKSCYAESRPRPRVRYHAPSCEQSISPSFLFDGFKVQKLKHRLNQPNI